MCRQAGLPSLTAACCRAVLSRSSIMGKSSSFKDELVAVQYRICCVWIVLFGSSHLLFSLINLQVMVIFVVFVVLLWGQKAAESAVVTTTACLVSLLLLPFILHRVIGEG